ncbi:MAG: hypothetical protein ACKOC5_13165 [Chloroflexota bacterium]
MSEQKVNRLLLISAVPGVLLLALVFYGIAIVLQVQNMNGAGMEGVLVLALPLLELALLALALGLVLYLFRSAGQDRVVSAVMAGAGLLVLFASPLLYYLPVPDVLLMAVQFLGPDSYLVHAAGVLAAGGLLSLALKRPQSEVSLEPVSSGEPPAG